MADERGVRHKMLQVLERCVEGSAPISAYIEFESAHVFDDTLSEDFRGQLDGLALLAEEFDWGLRGPEDFLEEARGVLEASKSGLAVSG